MSLLRSCSRRDAAPVRRRFSVIVAASVFALAACTTDSNKTVAVGADDLVGSPATPSTSTTIVDPDPPQTVPTTASQETTGTGEMSTEEMSTEEPAIEGDNDDADAADVWTATSITGETSLELGLGGGIMISSSTVTITNAGEWFDLPAADLGLGRFSEGFVLSDGFAIASEGSVLTSADGRTWSAPAVIADGESDRVSHIIEVGPNVVAVGRADDAAVVWTLERSSDGAVVGSEAAVLPTANRMAESNASAAADSGERTVVVGSSLPANTDIYTVLDQRTPTAWVSTNGVDWTPTLVPGDGAGRGGVFTSVVWSPSRGVFVAGGWDGVSEQDQRALIFTSPDGVAWTQQTSGAFDEEGIDEKLRDLVATPNGIIAVGGDEYAREPFGIIWRSDDGVFWERADVAETEFFSVAGLGDHCLAGGFGPTFIGPCGSLQGA